MTIESEKISGVHYYGDEKYCITFKSKICDYKLVFEPYDVYGTCGRDKLIFLKEEMLNNEEILSNSTAPHCKWDNIEIIWFRRLPLSIYINNTHLIFRFGDSKITFPIEKNRKMILELLDFAFEWNEKNNEL